MRLCLPILLLASFVGCTGTTDTPPAPEPVDLTPLREALAAHAASPGPDTLAGVSKAAGAVQQVPLGQPEVDLVLGDALCSHLLRPDLGLPRLAAHGSDLAGAAADPWLDCLVRAGEVDRFAVELQRVHARPVNTEIDGFKAAVVQARAHMQVGWREVMRAHDAGALVDARHPRGRPLDRPLADLELAFEVFEAMWPDHRVHVAVTRSARSERDDPLRDPGVIPVVGGRRRVLGYATDHEAMRDLARQVMADPPSRTFGVAIEAVDAEGLSQARLCAEGRVENGQLWLLTACHPTRELAWMQATERAVDGQKGGQPRTAAVKAAAEAFRDAVVAP